MFERQIKHNIDRPFSPVKKISYKKINKSLISLAVRGGQKAIDVIFKLGILKITARVTAI